VILMANRVTKGAASSKEVAEHQKEVPGNPHPAPGLHV
jgi:hypothetical protein